MGSYIRDNTEEAAQAADDAWSERGLVDDDPAYGEDVVKRPHVEIFAGTNCAYCKKAKELCESKGFPYRYVNIDEDEHAFDQLVGRIKTWKTVPQIFVTGVGHIGGFDELNKLYGDYSD